jgi:hypothetical protein
LQAFFDFIVAINGTRLDQDNDTLKQILKNGIGISFVACAAPQINRPTFRETPADDHLQ